MLIRSQDKKTLTKFNFISIYPSENRVMFNYDEYEDETVEVIAFVGRGSTIIGTYSTEEKAKKVLDEIEKSYVGTLWTEKDMIIANRIVFEMPQDDEV